MAKAKLDCRYMYIPVTISFGWIMLVLLALRALDDQSLSVFATGNSPFSPSDLGLLASNQQGNINQQPLCAALDFRHLNQATRERTSNCESPTSFGFASLGANGWTLWMEKQCPLISIFMRVDAYTAKKKKRFFLLYFCLVSSVNIWRFLNRILETYKNLDDIFRKRQNILSSKSILILEF